MSDEKTPPAPRDWSNIEVPSIPADDPIYSEGVIFTFPIRPRRAKADTEPNVETQSDDREAP